MICPPVSVFRNTSSRLVPPRRPLFLALSACADTRSKDPFPLPKNSFRLWTDLPKAVDALRATLAPPFAAFAHLPPPIIRIIHEDSATRPDLQAIAGVLGPRILDVLPSTPHVLVPAGDGTDLHLGPLVTSLHE